MQLEEKRESFVPNQSKEDTFTLVDKGLQETLNRLVFIPLFLIGLDLFFIFTYDIFSMMGGTSIEKETIISVGLYFFAILLTLTFIFLFIALKYDPYVKEYDVVFGENGVFIPSQNRNIQHFDIETIEYRRGIIDQGLFIKTSSAEYSVPGMAKDGTEKLIELMDKINQGG